MLNPSDMTAQEDPISDSILDELYLGLLKGDPKLEANTVFVVLRGKLVAFYKKYEVYRQNGDVS